MQGLAGNLKNIETQNVEKNNRPINPILIEILVTLAEEMKEYELSFIKTSEIEDESAILPYTPPDIVAVSFE